MRAGHVAFAIAALVSLVLGVAPTPTASPVLAAPPSLVVWFEEPRWGQAVFGTVEVVVGVEGEAERIELFVDDVEAGEMTRPPWRLEIDVGQENRERTFLVRAHGPGGEIADATLATPPLRVDEDVDVQLQELYVTVTDGGRRVLDLGAESFTILDEGVPQQISNFARGDVRLTAAILVDASASMKGARLSFALRGAAAFVAGLTPGDLTSLQVFSDRLLHATPYASDPEALTAGLATVAAAGGTALNDHLYVALRQLEAHPGRRVVVLLSDGIDGHSLLSMGRVKWLAERSGALIYWIRSTDLSDPRQHRYSAWKGPDQFRQEYQILTRAVTDSGGRILTLERLEDTEAAMREVLAELREQYVLGYHPTVTRNDGSFRRVRVRVRPGGFVVRTRGGYIDW